MRSAIHALVILGMAGVAATHPLAQAPPLSFEAASIKPRVGEPVYGSRATSPDRFDDPDTTLDFLIRWSYDLFDFQVVGSPEWVESKRWEISAKASAPIPRAAMKPLVRRLIDERFALKAHMEMRELPIYELVMARGDKRLGPGIKPAAVDCLPFLNGQRPMQESPPDADGFPLCSSGASFSASGLLTPRLNGQPLAGLVRTLEAELQRRVLDKTGLTGNFDIVLTYVDEEVARTAQRGTDGQPSDGPALLTALQEQLGMKLVSTRGPVEVLVIDSVSEPTPN